VVSRVAALSFGAVFMHVLCTALRARRRRSVGRSLRALALLFQIIVDRALSLTSGAILRIKMDDDVNLDAAPSTSGAVYRAFGPNRVLDLRPSRDGYGAIAVGKHGIGTISLYPNRVPSKRHVESALIHLEHDIIREAPGDAALRQYIEWDIDKLSAVFNSIRHQGVSFFFELMGSSSCNSFRHR
jgi:hypothetical protein